MAGEKRELQFVTIRMPKELYEQMKAMAQAQKRSMTSQIVVTLQKNISAA
jgi:predicted HicB family RNase H-like nuclease